MTEEITERRFEGIEFVHSRITGNETGFDDIPKQLAAKYGSGNFKNLPLNPQLAELVRLLVSVRDACAYCTILHSKEARDLGIPQAKIDVLPAWRKSLLFTEAETAALHYTEIVSDQDAREIQAAHDRLHQHFDNSQIEVILMLIVNMKVWTTMFLAQGRQPRFSSSR